MTEYFKLEALLAGDRMSAQDAERCGLVSKVFPVEELVDEAVKLGEKVAGMSKVAVAMAKEAVNAADNLPLSEGQIIYSFLLLASIHTSAAGMSVNTSQSDK